MTTITTKNYVITTGVNDEKAFFAVTDKAVQGKKKALNKLAWGRQYAFANKNGKFPIKYPHRFTVLGRNNIQAFITLINA